MPNAESDAEMLAPDPRSHPSTALSRPHRRKRAIYVSPFLSPPVRSSFDIRAIHPAFPDSIRHSRIPFDIPGFHWTFPDSIRHSRIPNRHAAFHSAFPHSHSPIANREFGMRQSPLYIDCLC
jgi:hypothetical protein